MINLKNLRLPTVDNPLDKLSGKRLLAVGIVSLATQLISMLICAIVIALALQGDSFSAESMETAMSDPLVSRISSVVGPVLGIAVGLLLIRSQLRPLFATVKNYAAILIGVAAAAVTWGVTTIFELIFQTPENANEAILNAEFDASPIIFIISSALLAPIFEEIVFRIGCYGFFRKFGRPAAYIASALIFGLIHLDFAAADITAELISIPNYVIPAVILAFLYDKFGFWSSCAMHITNNSLACLMLVI